VEEGREGEAMSGFGGVNRTWEMAMMGGPICHCPLKCIGYGMIELRSSLDEEFNATYQYELASQGSCRYLERSQK
jgi:hypothetical protein